MSTVTVVPIEEKAAVLDDKAKPLKPRGTSNRDYAMKFVCAAMSSKYPLPMFYDRVSSSRCRTDMAASGVSNPQDVYVPAIFMSCFSANNGLS